MTKLLIIRHGNTFDPDEEPRRVGARTDIPLVQSGIEQARALGRYIGKNNLVPDAVYASELQRAQETAIIMMREAGAGDTDIKTDKTFNEIDHGPDENKTEFEIRERIGRKAIEDWDDYNVVPDGWDVNPRAIQQSWCDFAEECLEKREGRVTCVVSSGGIIRFAPVILDDGGLPDGCTPKVKTASMSLLNYRDNQWHCDFWNKRPND
jgi:probable phosphoglycerate mutase